MIAPIDLNLLRTFAAVYETGRFSAAGARLGVPRSTVSRSVAALEERTGLLLFHRTTRTVTSTAAAAALFERVAGSLRALESGLVDLPESDSVPSGLLRITTTPDLATALLAEVATRFTARYPRASVDLIATQRLVDLTREGVDLALRISNRQLRTSSLVARKVGRIKMRLYAAPSYLELHPAPATPEDLEAHDWVTFRGASPLLLSTASASAKKTVRVERAPRLWCDDMTVAREVLRSGGGIGWLPSFVADADVKEGRLLCVLPRWTAPSGTAYLVQTTRRHVPPRVTAFRDLLLETLRRRPL